MDKAKPHYSIPFLWGLSGTVPRIAADDHTVLSKFSDTGQIEVTVNLRNDAATEILVRRSFDGEQQRLRFEYAGQISRDADAEAQLDRHFVPSFFLPRHWYVILQNPGRL